MSYVNFNGFSQSYVIKSAPWTILWFRILGIFSVAYIKRLCVFMFTTCSNSQLLRRVLWISAEQPIGASLKHKNTQPLYIFHRVRVLHLNRLKERTWLYSIEKIECNMKVGARHLFSYQCSSTKSGHHRRQSRILSTALRNNSL